MKILALFLSLLMLAGCQAAEEAKIDCDFVATAVEDSSMELLFVEDLDQNGTPELYLIYDRGNYSSELLGYDMSSGEALGSISMGRPADEVWWIAKAYNEEKVYLNIDSKGYACAADGSTCYNSHYITLQKGQLQSKTVFVSTLESGDTQYIVDGRILDKEAYLSEMADYLLQDGESGSVGRILPDGQADDLPRLIENALTNWENNK